MFDNAYNYNLIEYDGCTSGCSGTTFESTKSSTYKKGTNPSPLPSGLSNVQLATDRICISSTDDSCTPDTFEWYGLTRKTGWPPSSYDGVLSLY